MLRVMCHSCSPSFVAMLLTRFWSFLSISLVGRSASLLELVCILNSAASTSSKYLEIDYRMLQKCRRCRKKKMTFLRAISLPPGHRSASRSLASCWTVRAAPAYRKHKGAKRYMPRWLIECSQRWFIRSHGRWSCFGKGLFALGLWFTWLRQELLLPWIGGKSEGPNIDLDPLLLRWCWAISAGRPKLLWPRDLARSKGKDYNWRWVPSSGVGAQSSDSAGRQHVLPQHEMLDIEQKL